MNSATAGNDASKRAATRGIDAIIIALGAGVVLGLIITAQGRQRDDASVLPAHSPNDRSRYATIIALVDHGTYAIDEVIERRVDDKLQKTEWYSIDIVRRPDREHFYSSKPPLLPTILAGEYWLLKTISGGRFNSTACPKALVRTLVATSNWLPLVVFLALFARLLDRLTQDCWVRAFALAAAAGGTFLSGFSVTLNNHTVAAFFAFFALYPTLLIWLDNRTESWLFALTGLFAAFTATLELPALALAVTLFAALMWKQPGKCLQWFLPAIVIPIAANCYTTYLVTDSFLPTYEKKEWYEFEGSYWKVDPDTGRLVGGKNDPKSIDSQHEPWHVYLFHMMLGHHGVFSLTPIFVFSAIGMFRVWSQQDRSWIPIAALTGGLTLLIVGFYVIAPEFGIGQRNYGGRCNGMRWLFWLIPFWLIFLPKGLECKTSCRGFRLLALVCLLISAASSFYASRNPWTNPWLHELINQAGWIQY